MNNRQRIFPVYTLVKWIGIPLVRSLFRLRVRGREHVPRRGGLLIVANHISYFDPPILGVAMPRPIGYLAQVELFRTVVGVWFFRQLRCLPIDRARPGRASILQAVRRLQDGHCMGVFPEGGIREGEKSVLGGSPVLREGAGALALLAGVPIVPAIIEGTRQGYDWKRVIRLARPEIRVTFGEPFVLPKGHSRERAIAQITEHLLALAQEVQKKAELPLP